MSGITEERTDAILTVPLEEIDASFLRNEVFVGNPGAGMPSDIRSAFQARLVIEQCRVARVNVRATDDYVRLTKRITLATCVIAVATVVNVLLQVLLNWASFSK